MIEWLKRLLGVREEVAEVVSNEQKAAQELETIPVLKCDATSLISEKEIDLEQILSSTEIATAWSAVAPELEAFEIPDGTGGVNPGDRRAIFYLISHFKPCSVLEVGSHIGASSVHIAVGLHRSQKQDQRNRSLTSVDITDVNDPVAKPWLAYGTKYSPAELIESVGCNYFVKFVTKPSLPYMKECRQEYDFIFLDGDHGAKTVYQEIPAALEILKPGGLILLHDFFPGLKPLWSNGAVEMGPVLATERLKSEGAPLKVLPLGELPWPTKLGTNITSLAILTRAESD